MNAKETTEELIEASESTESAESIESSGLTESKGFMEAERVTEIRKLGKGRYLVSLESGFQFPLYRQELSECGISISSVGDELSEAEHTDVISGEMLSHILKEILPKRARLRAMHLLEKMDRSEAQLREKLRQSYYPDFIIENAVSYVKSYHYLDDLRYARSYLELHSAAKSCRLMEQELYAKGISKENVSQAVSETEFPDEEKQIRALLEKKHYVLPLEDKKTQQRACAFMMRKGYSMSAILRVLRVTTEE